MSSGWVCAETVTEGALRALFGPGVIVELEDPRRELEDLHPEERAAVAHAVPKRIFELAAGRRAARRAIEHLGLPATTIPTQADRSPAWPAEIVGSISHTDALCVAVVARAVTHRSLAVDLEPLAPLEEALWPSLFLPSELAQLEEAGEGERGILARLLFSAKECAYKLQYPITRSFLEFEDVEVSYSATGTFDARVRRGLPGLPSGSRFEGRFHGFVDHIVTGMVLRR